MRYIEKALLDIHKLDINKIALNFSNELNCEDAGFTANEQYIEDTDEHKAMLIGAVFGSIARENAEMLNVITDTIYALRIINEYKQSKKQMRAVQSFFDEDEDYIVVEFGEATHFVFDDDFISDASNLYTKASFHYALRVEGKVDLVRRKTVQELHIRSTSENDFEIVNYEYDNCIFGASD